jgi:CRP/FNR family transcriptional regulator, cyclic AMP receptor protein
MNSFGDCASVAWQVSINLANKIWAASLNVSNLALLDAYSRVSRTLLKHAVEVNGELVVNDLTHQEIANLIGASREMVSRIVKSMRLSGQIRTEGRTIIVMPELDDV